MVQHLVDATEHGFGLVHKRLALMAFDLKDAARLIAQRAVWAVVAVLFGLGALISLSAALYLGLASLMQPGWAMLVLAAVHLAVLGLAVWRLSRAADAPWAASPPPPEAP